MSKNNQGFTLIELLVVTAIIVILGAVVFLVINPVEFQKRGRDAGRISDAAIVQTALNLVQQDATDSAKIISGSTNPEDDTTRHINGTGWVKVDFASQKSVLFPVLPIDPINDSTYNYRYISDGNGWEIDVALESQQYAGKSATDGGNCDTRYEVGTNLTLQGC